MTGFVERHEAIGKEKGLREGLQQGLERGLERGLEQGLKQGMKRGQREARLATARNLVQVTTLDNATIAQATGLSEADVLALREDGTSHSLS